MERVLKLAKDAKTEDEKPIKSFAIKYDSVNQRVYAEVELADFVHVEGKIFKKKTGLPSMNYIYDIDTINRFLNCLEVQEKDTIANLLAAGNPKLYISPEFSFDDKIKMQVKDVEDKVYNTTFDPTTGRLTNLETATAKGEVPKGGTYVMPKGLKNLYILALSATKEEEKPILGMTLKYDSIGKKPYLEVQIAGFVNKDNLPATYYIYDEDTIKLYGDIFSVQEKLTSFDFKTGHPKFTLSPEYAFKDRTLEKDELKTPPKSTDDKKTSKKKVIRNVAILASTVLLTWYLTHIGSKIGGKDDVRQINDDINDLNNDTSHELIVDAEEYPNFYEHQQMLDELPAISEEEERDREERGVTSYRDVGSSIPDQDMQEQIDTINDVCFGYEKGITLQYAVVESDQETVRVFNDMRNIVVDVYNEYRDACEALRNNPGNSSIEATRNRLENEFISISSLFLDNCVNYMLENGNQFNGTVVKTFDSLSTFSKYVVTVAAQSILQLRSDYMVNTNIRTYDYNYIEGKFSGVIDDAYITLIASGYSR